MSTTVSKKAPQPVAVQGRELLGRPTRPAEQPDDHGDRIESRDQGAHPIGVGAHRLGPRGRDGVEAPRIARRPANGVPLGDELPRELLPAAAAADDQDSGHSGGVGFDPGAVLGERELGLPAPPAPFVHPREHLRDVRLDGLLGLVVRGRQVGRAQPVLLAAILEDPGLEHLLGQLRLAAGAAPLVRGLEHLLEVVDFVLGLELRRARGAPLEHVRPRARVVQPEEDQPDQETADEDGHDEGQRVHAARVYPRSDGRIRAQAHPVARGGRAPARPGQARCPHPAPLPLPGGRGFIVVLLLLFAVNWYIGSQVNQEKTRVDVPYTTFRAQVIQGNVKEIYDQGRHDPGQVQDGGQAGQDVLPRTSTRSARPSADDGLLDLLHQQERRGQRPADRRGPSLLATLLFSFGPTILLVGLFIFLMRRAAGGAGGG